MSRQATIERQHEKDARQVRQHYVHWGVKTMTSIGLAVIIGGLWLAWVLMTGSTR